MRHVFVETNWVVDTVAPAHHQNPAALQLLERARAGELSLHLPSPCLVSAVSARITRLRQDAVIDVFPLDEQMLDRTVALTDLDLQLKPHDQAILAAVLVRTQQLALEGERDVCFATIDADLQPWVRGDPLRRLYDEVGLWVYGDFSLRAPARPSSDAAGATSS